MVKSNEFKGASLSEAVRNATAAYRRELRYEFKNQRRCNDLLLEMSHLSREAGRYADEADRLSDDAESLRREAFQAGLLTLASALGGVVASALKARRAARALGRMRKGDLSRTTILEFLEAFGPLGTVASAALAAAKLLEARDLARQARDLGVRAERTGEEYLKAFDEYDRLGCGEPPAFIGA